MFLLKAHRDRMQNEKKGLRFGALLLVLSFLFAAATPFVYADETASVGGSAYQDPLETIIVPAEAEIMAADEAVYGSSNASAVAATTYAVDTAVYGAYGSTERVYQESYMPPASFNPVLPAPSGINNYFLTEESFSTGYHYIVSAPAGAYKAEGFLQLPSSVKLNDHHRFPQLMYNDVPYFFFGIYTGKGGLDVGICWQKTSQYPDGVWHSFVTVFPSNGQYYTHKAGAPIPELKMDQVLHMAAVQYDNGVRMELSKADKQGNVGELIVAIDFDIPGLALRADGRGTYFNREISLAQHVINYTNGAEMLEASWWDAKLHWRNYSSAWDSGVVSLMRTRWEPVSEKRVVQFEQSLYDGEKVSFIYKDQKGKEAAGK